MATVRAFREHRPCGARWRLGFARDQRADRPAVTIEILSGNPANVFPAHFSNTFEIALHQPPISRDLIESNFHGLAEDRVATENERRFDLILGLLQLSLADQLRFDLVNHAIDLALDRCGIFTR